MCDECNIPPEKYRNILIEIYNIQKELYENNTNTRKR